MILNFFNSVQNHENCQEFCKVSLAENRWPPFRSIVFQDEIECEAFTWTSNINSEYQVLEDY